MEELLKHLTEISIRQQQIVEHMAARQGETEREVGALRFTTAPRVQPPDPRVHAAQLLPKMTVHDDIEHYLRMFETIASREGWPREDWARILAPLLTGEPQQAYFSLPVSQADSYNELREEILARVGLSPHRRGPALSDVGIQRPVASPRPSGRTHPPRPALVARREPQRCPGSRTCRRGPVPSCTTTTPSAGSRHA